MTESPPDQDPRRPEGADQRNAERAKISIGRVDGYPALTPETIR
jgi:hypothetical protein